MQRNNLMQLAVSLCLIMGTFPVWYWYCSWALPDTEMVFTFTGGSLLLTALAWLHRKFGFFIERKSLLLAGIIARVIAILLGVGTFFLAHLYLTMAASVGAGILVWLFYLIAWDMLRFPVDRLLSVHAFLQVCVLYFLGILLCFLQQRTPFGDVNFLVLGLEIVLFGILRNRHMLTEATAGRTLPKGFHRHNLGLMVCFMLPGVVIFQFRRQIAALTGSILKAIGAFLLKLFQLMSVRFFQEEQFHPTESVPQALPERYGNPLIGWGFCLLVAGVTIYTLIRFRSELWDFLCMLASGMYQFLRRIVLARAPALTPESHPEYTDSVELLDTLLTRSERQKQVSWHQYYRRYRHIKDPAEKFRAGYAFWMKALKHWHADIPENAVPSTLLELSSGIPDPALTTHITEIYYKVRYGEQPPTEQELAEMERLVKTIRNTLLTVHYKLPEQ